MKNIIKYLINKLGYKITPIQSLNQPKILTNVFNSSCTKSVLISFSLSPFLEGVKNEHTNFLECYTAAEIFHELGYTVDVINFDEELQIDYTKYNIIYGFGESLEKAFYQDSAEQRIIKIFYGTGCNSTYSNKVSATRVIDFYKKCNILAPQSSRVVAKSWRFQTLMSDLVIALGNDFVVSTYIIDNQNLNCKSLPAFFFDVYDINIQNKNFESAQKHFLWFGSSGLLHKGLDLIIDIFSKRTDIFLHICGASKSEIIFFNYYQPIIDKSSNIIDHGFINLDSELFREIMNTCGFVIFPSVSEGGCPATLNVMANGGLVPIITTYCGLDLDQLGFISDEISEQAFTELINKALAFPVGDIKNMSFMVKEFVRKNYSYNSYKNNLTQLIQGIVLN